MKQTEIDAGKGPEGALSTVERDSVWCADITYIATAAGWIYLAAIIDLTTGMIVGWPKATHMPTELIVSALLNALRPGQPVRELDVSRPA